MGATTPAAPPGAELRSALLPLLRREEGQRLAVYDDATGLPIRPGTKVQGHPTIGVGRALDVRGITAEEAEMLLANDVAEVEAQLDQRIPWWRGLTVRRQAVLAAMAFQMGVAGLMGFMNTLAAARRGDYGAAAAGMLGSAWAKQTPGRAERMAGMMREG